MKENKLTFDTENLVVDWVGFNIEGSIDLEPIANYLFELLGFNSTITKKINGKWKSESLNYDKLNKFQVSFRQYDYNPEFKSYWVGTKVYFSGNNAAHFYKSIKIQPLNLDIFDFQRTSLARFYINYLTELKIKNKGIRSFQDLLFSYRIEEFEDRLAKYFYYQSFELLNLDTKYTNWLIHRFRTLYPKQRHSCLMTSYLKKYSQRDFKDQEKIFNLFRILSFFKNKKSSVETSDYKILAGQVYYSFTFPLIEYIRYIGMNPKSHSQRIKVLNILTTLQTLEPIIQNFDDHYFQSSLIVPAFNIKKKKNKCIVSVALAKELYSYSYPFQFSTYFTTYKYNYQFQVKLQIIQAISLQSLKKQFYVQDFLSQFNVSHAKQTQIKNVIIQTLDELKNNQVIQAQIEIHKTDNSLIKTNIITARLLTKTKIIYFYEIMQYQNLVL